MPALVQVHCGMQQISSCCIGRWCLLCNSVETKAPGSTQNASCVPPPLMASSLAAWAQVFDRVVVQPRDAREASDVFYKQVGRERREGRDGERGWMRE